MCLNQKSSTSDHNKSGSNTTASTTSGTGHNGSPSPSVNASPSPCAILPVCLSEEGSTDVETPPPLEGQCPGTQNPSLQGPGAHISEDEARMAVVLTEYFQEQRRVYEQICSKKRLGFSQINTVSQYQTLVACILLSKGAFCTPRSIIRGISIKKKPTSAQVIDEMKNLAEKGVGTFEAISEKEKVFYKPLPTETNRDLLLGHVEFEQYKSSFTTPVDGKFITTAQYNRILGKSPDKVTLCDEYGYKKRQNV